MCNEVRTGAPPQSKMSTWWCGCNLRSISQCLACVCVCARAGMYACMCIYVWWSEYYPISLSTLFLRHDLLLNLELTYLASLAGQQAPVIFLSLFLQLWDYTQVFTWVLGAELTVSYLQGKHFIDQMTFSSSKRFKIHVRCYRDGLLVKRVYCSYRGSKFGFPGPTLGDT